MNMKLKKILDDIQKTEDKIAELQEHLKRQNTLKQQIFPRNTKVAYRQNGNREYQQGDESHLDIKRQKISSGKLTWKRRRLYV